MRERPIGVFDSGVGGLTVLDELIKKLPNENYLYIGGEKFGVSSSGNNSLTLKSEKIIISITN